MKKFGIVAFFSILTSAVVVFLAGQEFEQKQKFFVPKGAVEGRYIVVLNDAYDNVTSETVEKEAGALTTVYGGSVDMVYSHAIKGYVTSISADGAKALSTDQRIAWVEQDSEIKVSDVQTNAPWNLDRSDQRTLPLDSTFTYDSTGNGAHIYIIDTGIRVTHQEFSGRASVAYDGVFDGQNGNDCNGHGTHVAGTAAGTTYGIAKDAQVYAVRVVGCSGTGMLSALIGGVDWIAANRVNPAVANISLISEGSSFSLEEAITNSVAQGIVYTVAAGNTASDACFYTPARTPSAITVGASWQEDGRAAFSNYGSCLDLFAPGNTIVSASIESDTALSTRNGTSMSAPLVAGVAAVFRAVNPSVDAYGVRQALDNASTMGVLTNTGEGSPNKLLYSIISSVPTPTPTPTLSPSPTISPSPTTSPSPSPSVSPTPSITPTPTVTPAPTPSASITGFVRRPSGRGIEDVTVRLQAEGVSRSTRTRENGSYSFSRVTLGLTYTITPLRQGWVFTPSSQSIFVKESVSNINFLGQR